VGDDLSLDAATARTEPCIIQGGMGVSVSSWRLAKAVSRLGQMGVVSGTALDAVIARRLQLGDPDGDVRRAIAAFPDQELAQRVLDRYFVEGGKDPNAAFVASPMYTAGSKRRTHELAVLGGFVEVFLAKEGHDGVVGINFLHKVQMPTPATLYGALLAGVDDVLVGAGIPRDIPGLIDTLVAHEPVSMPLAVIGDAAEPVEVLFDPRAIVGGEPPVLRRPRFLAIIASATLAISLTKRATGVDGFVIEGPTAGGHNAPPRGQMVLQDGQPVYGPRDEVDLAKIREIGLPFWLAGGYATPERLRAAMAEGAAGIQVGTVFAFCEESGIDPALKARVIALARDGGAHVVTDPLASPTGFPFKVVQLDGSLSEPDVYGERGRICDLGYLRETVVREDGQVIYRCPAEPVEDFVRKGGAIEDTVGRKCICNGLMVTAGLGQVRGGAPEPPIMTAGDDLAELKRLLPDDRDSYTAADVVAILLGESQNPPSG
jgi:nitronate monooxygenase